MNKFYAFMDKILIVQLLYVTAFFYVIVQVGFNIGHDFSEMESSSSAMEFVEAVLLALRDSVHFFGEGVVLVAMAEIIKILQEKKEEKNDKN